VTSTLPTKSDANVKSSSSIEKQTKKEEPAATKSNPWLEDDVARTNSNVRSNITKGSNSSKKANGSIAVATQINMKVQAAADGSTMESTNTSGKNKASKLAENAPSNTHNTKKNGDKKLPFQPPSNDKGTDVAKDAKRKRSDSVTSTTSGTKKAEEAAAPNAIGKKRQLIESTQEELVRMAFAGPDYEKDFQLQKDQEISRELGLNDKKMKVAKDVKAGWGDWAGPGAMMISDKIQAKRDKLLMQIQRDHETLKLQRQDAKKSNIMISEKRVKAQAKYKLAEVPHPFTSREEYERSLQMPLGSEWNASHVVQRMTQPEIKKRAGRIIEPIAQPLKKKAKTN
jgi:U3 small nucleolar RNA-associated protein 14